VNTDPINLTGPDGEPYTWHHSAAEHALLCESMLKHPDAAYRLAATTYLAHVQRDEGIVRH
jgi:hypothetical protein